MKMNDVYERYINSLSPPCQKMFSGLMASVHMCRERDIVQPTTGSVAQDPMPPPARFIRRPNSFPRLFWQGNVTARTANTSTMIYPLLNNTYPDTSQTWTYSDKPLLPADGQDRVVASWSPSGGVDKDVDCLVHNRCRRPLRKHNVEVDGTEDLLERVKSEAAELTFDQIWAVLHDGLELEVPVPALPPGDEVQHVGALSSLPVLPAGVAGEGDGEGREEGEVGGLVAHSEEAREEVDLGCDCGDGQEARGAHDEEGEYCLVGEVRVDVGGLLQDDDVASRAFGR